MKLTSKNATLLQIIGIALVALLTVVTMWYPDVIGFPYSLEALREKQDGVETLNRDLRSADTELSKNVQTVMELQDTVVSLTAETERIKEQIRYTNFDLHIPSLLLFIEQQAQANQLELEIVYDHLRSFEGDVDMEQYEESLTLESSLEDEELEEDMDETDEEVDDNDEDDSDDESEDELEDEEVAEESSPENLEGIEEDSVVNLISGHPFDLSGVHHAVPTIEGIDVATIPFNVTGNYSDVRSFLIELDAIDFIEANTVDIYSYGESLSANMVMNVFYMTDNEEGYDE